MSAPSTLLPVLDPDSTTHCIVSCVAVYILFSTSHRWGELRALKVKLKAGRGPCWSLTRSRR